MSKTKQVREAETVQLEWMTARGIQVSQLEARKKLALEEVQSSLAKVIIFDREELKPQVVLRPKENKRNNLSAFEAKLKSYERQNLM